uniref:Uncharacterized protein n=1 Tax=Caenorhabditis japonica TaxID=281687 RepID=A0A8R1IVR8_CAEJA
MIFLTLTYGSKVWIFTTGIDHPVILHECTCRMSQSDPNSMRRNDERWMDEHNKEALKEKKKEKQIVLNVW